MPNKTLHDVILWTQDFHREMSERLQQSAGEASDERVRMLLGYLSQHEQELAQMVGRFG